MQKCDEKRISIAVAIYCERMTIASGSKIAMNCTSGRGNYEVMRVLTEQGASHLQCCLWYKREQTCLKVCTVLHSLFHRRSQTILNLCQLQLKCYPSMLGRYYTYSFFETGCMNLRGQPKRYRPRISREAIYHSFVTHSDFKNTAFIYVGINGPKASFNPESALEIYCSATLP